MKRPVVSLLTDFGLEDAYVGIMKGVILGIVPDVQLIDLTHRIPAQDVASGAYQLEAAWSYLPGGTVHLAVVDPGVGGARLPIAVAAGGHLFVGPDNGLLEPALALPGAMAVAATEPRWHRHPVSRTFHGRDIFAPVAGWLAAGLNLGALGPIVSAKRLQPPQPYWQAGALHGEIVSVDVFGNVITNLKGSDVVGLFEQGARLHAADVDLGPLSRTYADVAEGELLVLIGSSGRVEISERGGSASTRLNLKAGASVSVSG